MGFDQHFKTVVPFSLLMIVGNVYLWSQIVSLWILAPIVVFLLVLNLDIFGGLFISVFVQVILLGAGLGIPRLTTPAVAVGATGAWQVAKFALLSSLGSETPP